MEWKVLRAADPRSFLSHFTSRGLRPDGRSFLTRRQVTVAPGAIGTADGSAIARVGATTVLAACSLEVSAPLNAAPRDGFLEISVQLTPLCSPRFKVGRPPDEALAMQQHLQRIVLSGGVLDLEQLCIVEGKAVWNLKLDVVCLNHDGSCTDAALLAVVGALANLRVPATTVIKTTGTEGGRNRGGASAGASRSSRDAAAAAGASGVLVETLPHEAPSSLVLGGIPLSLTFGVFEDNLLVDPNAEEETLMDSVFTLVVGANEGSDGGSNGGNDQMKLFSVYKPGGVPLGFNVMDNALDSTSKLVQGDAELVMRLAQRA